MTRDSFSFGAKNSYDDWGIKCIAYDVLFPTKRNTSFIIPQRDGSYEPTEERYYDDRTIRVDCTLTRKISKFDLRQIAYQLSLKSRLQFWNEPEVHYYAEIFDAAEVLDWPAESGRDFSLTFVAEPFAYSEYKRYPLIKGINKIPYAGTRRAPGVFTLENTGADDIRTVTFTVIKRKVE